MAATVADFLPDFSKGETPSNNPVVEFEAFVTEEAERSVWKELFPINENKAVKKIPVPDQPQRRQHELKLPARAVEAPVPSNHQPQTMSVEEHEAIIADLTKHHDDLIEDLKQKQADNVVNQLEELRSQLLNDVTLYLETTVAEALKPIAREMLIQSATQQLIKQVKLVLEDYDNAPIIFRGPPEFLDQLQLQLDLIDQVVTTKEAETVELVFQIEDVVLSTKIGNWAEQLGISLNA